ncbi:MAG: response regulator transcription factor [Bacteroidota bacterium]|nr:response regulator transcription factor [Bacteroidota bacterium]
MSQQVNILFAEDHKLFRELLISELKQYNIITIGEAGDGFQLLDLLKSKEPDLILLDIEMPNMNGSETFDKIRKQYPDLKIILLTSYSDDVLINYFYSRGASAYLNKNTDVKIVAETIHLVYKNEYVPILKKTEEKNGRGQKPNFSRRESEILQLIIDGKSNKEIAEKLNITIKTVEAHKKNLFKKTKTQSSVGFVSYILKKGLNYLK